jgi:pectinesterase
MVVKGALCGLLLVASSAWAQNFTVAADGRGDFRTVQEAVDKVPEGGTRRYVIHIRPGTYKQQLRVPRGKAPITFLGDDAATTILTYDLASLTAGGTGKSASTFILADDFRAENVSFANSYGTGSQAVAIYITADRVVFRKCRFLGWQDTVYANGVACPESGNCIAGRQYFRDCYIEGHVDFIFGNAAAVFDNCEIHSKGAGYVTAQSKTYEGHESGYVFRNCRLTGSDTGRGVYLGRPWRPYAFVVFIDCELGSHILAAGWSKWNGTDSYKTTYYGEYHSTGPGANPAGRAEWSHQLTAQEAAKFETQKFLAGADGWNPLR